MSYTIRKGTEKDVPGMYRLIKELATFERAPNAVINTEENLLKDGFGPNPSFFVLIAEEDGTKEVIGMALYHHAYSTWKGRIFYLDDLIVTETKRKGGIGRKLLDEVLVHGKNEGVSQIRWHVLDWNTPAIDFYKKMGVEMDEDWITCKMSKEAVTEYLDSIK